MEINDAIRTMEAAGFHLYRRIVNGSDLITALLVYPPVDMYAEVDSLLDGVLLRLNSLAGDQAFKCIDRGSLMDTLRAQIQAANAAWEAKGLPPAFPDLEQWFEGAELSTIQRLRSMKASCGDGFEAIWLTRKSGFKCLYRGAVIAVNKKLITAIGVDGKRVEIPLDIALALLDEMDGLEKQQIEEPKELEA
ncbi:MAG: hypothetical protein PVG38_06620 [Gammaproteobacteria bacterium]|jgi:hypothetical protein